MAEIRLPFVRSQACIIHRYEENLTRPVLDCANHVNGPCLCKPERKTTVAAQIFRVVFDDLAVSQASNSAMVILSDWRSCSAWMERTYLPARASERISLVVGAGTAALPPPFAFFRKARESTADSDQRPLPRQWSLLRNLGTSNRVIPLPLPLARGESKRRAPPGVRREGSVSPGTRNRV